MHWNHWVLITVGGWLILSPWVLGFSALDLPTWNNVLFGGFCIIVAFADSFTKEN